MRIKRRCPYRLHDPTRDPGDTRLEKPTTCPIPATPLWIWGVMRASELEHWVGLDDMDLVTLQGIEILRATRGKIEESRAKARSKGF